ncbi:hypothetical protein A2U01_0065216, partial [Trifolium medium]|nr:hypothetical protein [Trifolium medium]
NHGRGREFETESHNNLSFCECGYDAAIHVIENHTAIAVRCGCCDYRISNTAAVIPDRNLKPGSQAP